MEEVGICFLFEVFGFGVGLGLKGEGEHSYRR